MNIALWIFILICCALGFGYVVGMDIIKKNQPSGQKYFAIALVLLLSILATWFSTLQRYVGSPIMGLFLGMIVYNVIPKFPDKFTEGTTFGAKKFLPLAIILIGATLSFTQMAASIRALPLVIFNICMLVCVAFLIGKLAIKVSSKICTMVGGGTSICGGTAIATLGGIMRADTDELGFAMTAIFFFDMFSCIIYPYLAQWIHLSPEQYSFLAGTAVNDTSSVAASAAQYAVLTGHPEYATGALSVKLVRTTMLVFLALIVTVVMTRVNVKEAAGGNNARVNVGSVIIKSFPWFVLGFILMAILNTFGIFDSFGKSAMSDHSVFSLPAFFGNGSKFLITCALVAVGFKMKFKDMFSRGYKTMLLGGLTWVCAFLSSMTFIHVFANYVNNTKLFH